jgi:hypothetical protein
MNRNLWSFWRRRWLLGWSLAAVTLASALGAGVRVGIFQSDVTPPIGHPLCGGWIEPVIGVDDPLLAKGIVLEAGGQLHVVCSVDWCLLQTRAHEAFVRALAEAVGTSPERVSVHTVHQHNAPIADARAQELLDQVEGAPLHLDLDFLRVVTDRLGRAAAEAKGRMRAVTAVGFGKAKVERFASNRRVLLDDGKIHARYSATTDPVMQAAPEGLIDPWLRTVSLFDGQEPLVRMHYYATHPMSYYGDGRVTADTVGLARERLEREELVPQIYFTGCGGNITAGKYNDGSPESRVAMTERVLDAMRRSVRDSDRVALDGVTWRTTEVELPLREGEEWSEGLNRRRLALVDAPKLDRLKSALNLAWIERCQRQPRITLSGLELGPVSLVHLPGECFVEYQLYAQGLVPDRFVVVAAYGESGTGYVCCDAAFAEGGYEPTMSRVAPPTEERLKAGIARLLE